MSGKTVQVQCTHNHVTTIKYMYPQSPYPYRMTIGGVRGGRPPHMLQRYMFLHPTLVLKPTDLNTV